MGRTHDGLVLMRDGKNGGRCGVQQVCKQIAGLKRVIVESLAAGTDGTLWIGTQVGIVRSVAGSPGVFRIMTRAQGLIDRQVTALATDRSGNMWAGTGVSGFGGSHRRCSSR